MLSPPGALERTHVTDHVHGLCAPGCRGPRRAAAWLGILALLLGGCGEPVRITVPELQRLEQSIAMAPTVTVQPQALSLTDFQPYRVMHGDILEIRMVGLGSPDRYQPTSVIARVHPDGTVSLPVVGKLEIGGHELAAVEEIIREAHVPSIVKDLAVFVQLVADEDTTVLVQGAAGAPGLVKLRENERNALYALAQAGGFNDFASGLVRVKPIRPERPELVYNLNDINDVRRAMLDRPLESGDVVLVDAAQASFVYVTGLVNAPGPIGVPPRSSLSVLRAVAAAGGLQPYLYIKDAVLTRALPSGQQVQVNLNLEDMLGGRTPDLALAAGDVLDVTPNLGTFVQEWAFKNLLVGPFGVGVRYDPLQQYNTSRAIDASDDNGSLGTSIRDSLTGVIPGLIVPPVTP